MIWTRELRIKESSLIRISKKQEEKKLRVRKNKKKYQKGFIFTE